MSISIKVVIEYCRSEDGQDLCVVCPTDYSILLVLDVDNIRDFVYEY